MNNDFDFDLWAAAVRSQLLAVFNKSRPARKRLTSKLNPKIRINKRAT